MRRSLISVSVIHHRCQSTHSFWLNPVANFSLEDAFHRLDVVRLSTLVSLAYAAMVDTSNIVPKYTKHEMHMNM